MKWFSLIVFFVAASVFAGGIFSKTGNGDPTPTLTPPSISIPQTRQIYQRNVSNLGAVTITGTYVGAYTVIQAQASVINGGTPVGWQNIVIGNMGSPFTGTLNLAPGWYNVQVRVLNGAALSNPTTVTKVGVGELFICAGQSLLANYGQTANNVTDDRVSARTYAGAWQIANDPQPLNGDASIKASPIPLIGSALAVYLNMPVGFMDAAVGGTSTDTWIATLYASNLLPAMQAFGLTKFRAILWEQGQQDALIGNSTATYEANTTTIINQSRSDAGWNVPWGIADRSTIQTNTAFPTIQAGQDWLVANTTFAFGGSDSDSITNADRYDTTHFNTAGQVLQANMWVAAIKTYFGW